MEVKSFNNNNCFVGNFLKIFLMHLNNFHLQFNVFHCRVYKAIAGSVIVLLNCRAYAINDSM